MTIARPGGGHATRDLSRLLHARSVCLIGASGDSGRTAGQPLQILAKHGFAGPIVCVNPKYDSIQGRPCYRSIEALPEAVDVALITLPAARVPDAIRDCGRRGIRNVVVLSAGFEETAEGRGLGAQVARHALEHGVTVVGPNSEGLWSTPAKLLLTHGTAAQRETILAGGVSVLSQSGSIGAAIVRSLQDAGVGCRYLVSLGNETNLTLTDCLEWMVDEGGSRVILLFVEGLRDGGRFVAAARRAAAAGIAVAALKAGASDAGRAATASHTGKIASSARVYAAMFRQARVIEAQTLVELLEAGEVLSVPATAPTGGGIGIVSASGGCRALLADAAERRAMALASFGAGTLALLATITEGRGVVTNPIDVPMEALYDVGRFAALTRAVAADAGVGSIVVQYANRGVRQVADHVGLFGEVRAASGKPVVVSFLGDPPPAEAQAALRARGVICAREPDQALRYLDWMRQVAQSRQMAESGRAAESGQSAGFGQAAESGRDAESGKSAGFGQAAQSGRDAESESRQAPGAGPAAGAGQMATEGIEGARGVGASLLSPGWEGQLAFLTRCAIAVPEWRAVGPGADPVEACRELRFPVAVKAFPQDSDHKAEAGLVQVDVADGAGLVGAVAAIRERLPALASVLVQEMVAGGVEVLLAARRDPDFGPVLAIGTGGTRVEWLADVTYLHLPAPAPEIRAAIGALKLAQLLRPFRGRPAADGEALVAAASRLGAAFLACPGLSEVEVNPLFVRPAGEGVIAVDVLTR